MFKKYYFFGWGSAADYPLLNTNMYFDTQNEPNCVSNGGYGLYRRCDCEYGIHNRIDDISADGWEIVTDVAELNNNIDFLISSYTTFNGLYSDFALK